MNVFDILLLSVEVSIALAGFAGIIATFQINNVKMVRRSTVGALTVVVQFSLLAALSCGICLSLSAFGVMDKALWAATSSFGAVIYSIAMYASIKLMRGAITNRSNMFIFVLLQGIGTLVVLALTLNVLDIVFHREPGPLIVAILYALSVAGYMFSRLLLIPLWRIVREQEAVIQQ